MIGPDGNVAPGPYSELESGLVERAAAAGGFSRRRVFLDHSAPSPHGGEYWNVMLGVNSGPGTNTTMSTWSYWNRTYLEGVERLRARINPWAKPWQEKLREEILHLPWDAREAWFLHVDPQDAWRACLEGRHLLWVIGHDPGVPQGDPSIRDCARDIARWVVEEALPTGVDPAVRSLYYALDEGEASRLAVAARLPAIKELGESGYGLDPAEVPSWHFERVVLFASLATFGEHRRLDYAAYDAAQLLYAVLPPPEVSRELAALVRRHFPKERFTR